VKCEDIFAPRIIVKKFHDKNMNGVKDQDEVYISGWKVDYYYAMIDIKGDVGTVDGVVYTTVNDQAQIDPADGVYLFEEELPAGIVQTVSRFDGPALDDSQYVLYPDATPEIQIEVKPAENALWLVEYGNVGLSKARACKYMDMNENREWDEATEPAIPDWQFRLHGVDVLARPVDISKKSDSTGCAEWTGLFPGEYTIEETVDVNSGWTARSETSQTFQAVSTLYQEPELMFHKFTFLNIYKRKQKLCKIDDVNGNGVADPGEAMPLWQFKLFRGQSYLGTFTTDTSGCVETTSLIPGVYTVEEVIPPEPQGWTSPVRTQTFEVSHLIAAKTITFVNQYHGKITACKMNDLNGNGIVDPTEPPIQGWIFELWHDGVAGPRQITDSTGCTTFENLDAGTYIVKEIVKSLGWEHTEPVDEAPDPLLGLGEKKVTIVPGLGDPVVTLIFTNVCNSKIKVCKYLDMNENGKYDEGIDRLLTGWHFTVHHIGTQDICDHGSNPCTIFDKIIPGDWEVCEIMPKNDDLSHTAWTATAPVCKTITISPTLACNTIEEVYFFNIYKGLIKACKILDFNSNGAIDDGEPLISDWKFQLYRTGESTPYKEQQTDGTGCTLFTDLLPGGYDVKEVMPPTYTGWSATGFGENKHIEITEGLNKIPQVDVTFTNIEVGEIRACKKLDMDEDGFPDEFEPPVSGWVMTLTGKTLAGTTVGTTCTTDSSGCCSFSGLLPGDYVVTEQVQPAAGWLAPKTVSKSFTIPVTLTEKTFYLAEFANIFHGEIHICKYHDLNKDGVHQPEEPGVAGWPITLSGGQLKGPISVLTEGDGCYTFSKLLPGTYTIEESTSIPGWSLTGGTKSVQSVSITQNLGGVYHHDVTFFNYYLGIVRACKIFDKNEDSIRQTDEQTVSGWIFKLLDSAQNELQVLTTDTSGCVEFKGLAPGAYVVQEVVPESVGWRTVSPVTRGVTIDPNLVGTVTVEVFFYDVYYGEIVACKYEDDDMNGVVSSGDFPVSGWKIELWQNDVLLQTQFTNEKGCYSFTKLLPGTYVVKEVHPSNDGWVHVSSDSFTVDISAQYTGSPVVPVDFLNAYYGKIKVCKIHDLNKNGVEDGSDYRIAGWPFRLTGRGHENGKILETESNGCVTFNNLLRGVYKVEDWMPDKPHGWRITGLAEQQLTVEPSLTGIPTMTLLFYNVFEGKIKVCKNMDITPNNMVDPGEPMVSGWKIVLESTGTPANFLPMTQWTDGSGCTVFEPLIEGEYKITEVPPPAPTGWRSLSVETVTMQITPNRRSGEEAYIKNHLFSNIFKGKIHACKYFDWDENGQKSTIDTPLAGWTILLYRADIETPIDRKETDSNGCVDFTELLPGTYTVVELLPISKSWTSTSSTSRTVTIEANLLSVEPIYPVEFFNIQKGKITICKVEDSTPDQNQDAGESLVAGWPVALNGQPDGVGLPAVHISTTTNSEGCAIFTGLLPGTYVLSETIPANTGWTAVGPTTIDKVIKIDYSTTVDITLKFYNIYHGKIRVCKFLDENDNGLADPNEKAIEGWTVQLYSKATGAMLKTAQTESDGCFTFDQLLPGMYVVKEAIPNGALGWEHVGTTYHDVKIEAVLDEPPTIYVNFSNIFFGSIKVCKYEKGVPEEPIEGWWVELRGPDGLLRKRTTQTDGCYTFTRLLPGKYNVTEYMKSGWRADGETWQMVEIVPTKTGDIVSNVKFVNYFSASITACKVCSLTCDCEHVMEHIENHMVPGWMFRLIGANYGPVDMTTTQSGCVTFRDLRPGKFTLQEMEATGLSEKPVRIVDVDESSTGANQNVVFGGTCSGSITACKLFSNAGYSDKASNLPDYRFTLTGTTLKGVAVAKTHYTNESGCVTFAPLSPGTYKLTELVPEAEQFGSNFGTAEWVPAPNEVDWAEYTISARPSDEPQYYQKNFINECKGKAIMHDVDYWASATGMQDIGADEINIINQYFNSPSAYFSSGDEPFDGRQSNNAYIGDGTPKNELKLFLMEPTSDPKFLLAKQLIVFFFNVYHQPQSMKIEMLRSNPFSFKLVPGVVIQEALKVWAGADAAEQTKFYNALKDLNSQSALEYIALTPCHVRYGAPL
jgi:uncharacterized surface anchored protein